MKKYFEAGVGIMLGLYVGSLAVGAIAGVIDGIYKIIMSDDDDSVEEKPEEETK